MSFFMVDGGDSSKLSSIATLEGYIYEIDVVPIGWFAVWLRISKNFFSSASSYLLGIFFLTTRGGGKTTWF